MTGQIFPPLDFPRILAAGPGPGNIASSILKAFAMAGVVDQTHSDVQCGIIECKRMLCKLCAAKNTYTFGVSGTEWSGLKSIFAAVMPGDKVVAYTKYVHAANPLDLQAACVTVIDVRHGVSVTGEKVDASLKEHKPKWADFAHWETGYCRINDPRGLLNACVRHGSMGLFAEALEVMREVVGQVGVTAILDRSYGTCVAA